MIMRNFLKAAITSAAMLALSSCDKAQHDRVGAGDTAAVEKMLRDNETRWNALYKARDAAGLAAIYANDAALANPGVALVEGAPAIGTAVTQFVSDPNLDVQFGADRVQVAQSGDLAYTRGHFTMRSTDPATRQPRTDTGNYLTVWKKQPDGSWKAVEDFVVPGAPASAAAEEPAA
jgi:ketosteroid isomerase-like protein